jgi:hypothetical protein
MENKESKISIELTELKDSFNKILEILDNDITKSAKTLSEKVDLNAYEYSEEEQKIVDEIEPTVESILEVINGFYTYANDKENINIEKDK